MNGFKLFNSICINTNSVMINLYYTSIRNGDHKLSVFLFRVSECKSKLVLTIESDLALICSNLRDS